MSENTSDTNETAKAVGKGIDAASKFASFLSAVFGDTLTNVGEIAANQTVFWKYKNALRIQDKVEQEIKSRKLEGKTVSVQPRLGIPLLDAAVEEDDEYLQELWSKLLTNAMDPKSTDSVKKSYVQILKQLDPLDAKILHVLFHFFLDKQQKSWAAVGWGKNEVEVGLSLRNLERLGLVEITKKGADDSYEIVFGDHDDKDSTKFKRTFTFHIELKALGWHLLKNCTNFRLESNGGGEIVMLDW